MCLHWTCKKGDSLKAERKEYPTVIELVNMFLGMMAASVLYFWADPEPNMIAGEGEGPRPVVEVEQQPEGGAGADDSKTETSEAGKPAESEESGEEDPDYQIEDLPEEQESWEPRDLYVIHEEANESDYQADQE